MKFLNGLSGLFSLFYVSRKRFIKCSVESYNQINNDISKELYSSDANRIKKNFKEINLNKRLSFNPFFFVGVFFPVLYVLYLQRFVATFKIEERMENLRFHNSAVYYLKKQLKYLNFYLTGFKGFLK